MNSHQSLTVCTLLGMLISIPAQAYTIYVSNEKDNTLSVIDGETLEMTETIEIGQRPRGMTLSLDNKTLYVCTSDDNHVEVLDLATHEVTHTLPSGPDPELMALGAEGKMLYIANEGR